MAHVNLYFDVVQDGGQFYQTIEDKLVLIADYGDISDDDAGFIKARDVRFEFAQDFPEYAYVVRPEYPDA